MMERSHTLPFGAYLARILAGYRLAKEENLILK